MTDARLIAAGWKRTPSGRWLHADAPPLERGRRRLFTEAEALTLLNAEQNQPSPDVVRLSTDGKRAWDEWCSLINQEQEA